MDSLFGTAFGIGGTYASNKVNAAHLTGAEQEQNAFNAQMMENAQEFNAGEAQKSRDFTADMDNTLYQRRVADMRAAGINPALAIGGVSSGTVSTAAATSSPVSGSGRGVPTSMSEIMEVLRMRKEMSLLDAQREKTLAEADSVRKGTERIALEMEWIPKRYAAEIGLNEKNADKAAQEVKNLLQSEEAQKLANEWNPKLWKNELDNGRVNRNSTIVGIQKVLQEIENLRAEESNILEDTRVKQLTQGLIAAQTVLAEQNSREVSAEAWRKEWTNAFIELYGHAPDQPVWNAVTSILSETGGTFRDVLRHPFGIGRKDSSHDGFRKNYGSR